MTESNLPTGALSRQTQALDEIAFRASLLTLNAAVEAASGVRKPEYVAEQAVNETLSWIEESLRPSSHADGQERQAPTPLESMQRIAERIRCMKAGAIAAGPLQSSLVGTRGTRICRNAR